MQNCIPNRVVLSSSLAAMIVLIASVNAGYLPESEPLEASGMETPSTEIAAGGARQYVGDGDLVEDCVERLSLCNDPEHQEQMLRECGGTCLREGTGQNHAQNCESMADLCQETSYNDIMSRFCQGTCWAHETQSGSMSKSLEYTY
ncbi:hypothetical protein DdX_12649 [Ditylenchus destructor]|uniref:ShKT domain-containing protein n=1 Tax=Ditylenchus destructor TaxID=166010 RepID=A0AAD4R3A4_9BILA|nr:hypothetical protein DdX_12649 [Ditylenchus destructor]